MMISRVYYGSEMVTPEGGGRARFETAAAISFSLSQITGISVTFFVNLCFHLFRVVEEQNTEQNARSQMTVSPLKQLSKYRIPFSA